jgi:hypothetical protein
MRGADGRGRSARSDWVTLWRLGELEERVYWTRNSAQRGPAKENHIAEEMANGKVGSLNQYRDTSLS